MMMCQPNSVWTGPVISPVGTATAPSTKSLTKPDADGHGSPSV